MDAAAIALFKQECEKVLKHLHGEFSKIQTGRANAALVEDISVEAYGQRQPLKSLAGLSVQEGRTIVVQPWDRSIAKNVEKALVEADLGTSPTNDGSGVIRMTLPPMTEERREQLTKIVHKIAEEARISVRQQRDIVREKIKAEKEEDVRYTSLEKLDEASKETNDKIEESMKKKEQEVMTV